MKTVAFFNNKGGVGKTTLVYHVSSMLARLGLRVLCADLDPQANLTAMFLSEDNLETLLEAAQPRSTIFGSIYPITQGTGDIAEASIFEPNEAGGNLGLIAGDLDLSSFEDRLAIAWNGAAGGDPADMRATTALHRIVTSAAAKFAADIVLMDVGPNLGAINRAALIAADHITVPMAPDLYSLQGLRNLGSTLRSWRRDWAQRKRMGLGRSLSDLPVGAMEPIGYVVLQHAVRLDRPVQAYGKWMQRIPTMYAEHVAIDAERAVARRPFDGVREDPNCLASLKNYRSLMPLAQEARKPMFALRVADGALGAQQSAVIACYHDFKILAIEIARRVGFDSSLLSAVAAQ